MWRSKSHPGVNNNVGVGVRPVDVAEMPLRVGGQTKFGPAWNVREHLDVCFHCRFCLWTIYVMSPTTAGISAIRSCHIKWLLTMLVSVCFCNPALRPLLTDSRLFVKRRYCVWQTCVRHVCSVCGKSRRIIALLIIIRPTSTRYVWCKQKPRRVSNSCV